MKLPRLLCNHTTNQTHLPSVVDKIRNNKLIRNAVSHFDSKSNPLCKPEIRYRLSPRPRRLCRLPALLNFDFKLCFLSAGRALGLVVYTGRETRSVMNTSHPVSKIGLLDLEVNNQTKILFGLTVALAVTMIALRVRFKIQSKSALLRAASNHGCLLC